MIRGDADAPTAALLEEVFPGTRVGRADYLRWLYRESPFGEVIEANLDDDAGRAGHYAVVPVELAVDGSPRPAALSLNTAVHPRARGGGTFVRLASECYDAARERGIEIVVGVANANSTPGFLRRLEFELVTPLPAQVLLPLPSRTARGWLRSGWADDEAVLASLLGGGDGAGEGGGARAEVREGEGAVTGTGAGAGEASIGALITASPPRGIGRTWTVESLRWRLRSPGSRFALHRGDGVLMVTTSDARRGVNVAVIAKVFAARPLGAGEARALVRAACRTHRAPFALHIGVNDRVTLAGLALPERLRPSPLNLIYRALDGQRRTAGVVRFEALDFDAY